MYVLQLLFIRILSNLTIMASTSSPPAQPQLQLDKARVPTSALGPGMIWRNQFLAQTLGPRNLLVFIYLLLARLALMTDALKNQHGQPHSYGQPHLGTGMTTGVQSGQAGYHNASGPPPDQIPSSSAIGTNQQGAGQHAMTGKVEHAVGAMIGSKSLKAKGIQKEQ